MKLFLFVVFVTCAFAHTIQKPFSKDKVIGGSAASQGQFPYQISERYYRVHVCGGSIIDKNTILTAAHCVEGGLVSNLQIFVGSINLNGNGVWYSVSSYKMHESWNPTLFVNDIAVITTSNPIQFTTNIAPIAIDSTFIPNDVQFIFLADGVFTSYPGSISNNLQFYKGRILDLETCKQRLNPTSNYPVMDSNICTNPKRGQGVCVYDSGGPLVANGKLIGLTSWGMPCAIGYPDVFTRVSYYTDWITTNSQNRKTNLL